MKTMLRFATVAVFSVAVCFCSAVERGNDELEDIEQHDISDVVEREALEEGTYGDPESETDFTGSISSVKSGLHYTCRRAWPWTKSCYYIYTQCVYTWSQAKQQCRNYGATLVTISDRAENKYLSDFIDGRFGKVWIGLNDRQAEGCWVWDSGKSSSYRNWYVGEPNGGRSENCVAMRSHRQGRWNDESCYNRRGFICKF
ncbi:C-type lectin lectoxin-Thr1-like [Ptychodera flava]|uniref:C-type lectin lectoxin-Thr1-like n=1 Tax=Ptychodera flava TaxID=63121 RepID=UPI00396A11F3